MKIIIKGLNKEKSELEELIFKQDAKVTNLASKIKVVEKNIKEKNRENEENEQQSLKLVEIIEEQKKQIESLGKYPNSNTAKDKIVLSTRDEIELKKMIEEKDTEINNLKIYNENLKNDLHGK